MLRHLVQTQDLLVVLCCVRFNQGHTSLGHGTERVPVMHERDHILHTLASRAYEYADDRR